MDKLPIEKSKGLWKKGKKYNRQTSAELSPADESHYPKVLDTSMDAEIAEDVEKAEKERKLHTPKAKRCIQEVKKKGENVNPYAVCTASIGKKETILPPSERK